MLCYDQTPAFRQLRIRLHKLGNEGAGVLTLRRDQVLVVNIQLPEPRLVEIARPNAGLFVRAPQHTRGVRAT